MNTSPWWLVAVALPPLLLSPAAGCPGDDPIPDQDYNLSDDVRVSYDGWGIPHVYGKTLADVAFAQGYVTAHDRLWQMDYLRRQAKGELAEIFGQGYYNGDLTMRTLGFYRHAEEAYHQLEATDPAAVEVLWAYSNGVNTYLDEVASGKGDADLPPQIQAIGYIPEPWHPLDSLTMDKALAYGSSAGHMEELVVWLTSKIVGWDTTNDLLRPATPGVEPIVPGFYDTVATIPPPAARTAPPRTDAPLTPELRAQYIKALQSVKETQKLFASFAGSNNWIISGDLTKSGFPILANDTHEGVDAPPTYYQIHMNTADAGGDLDIAGYGFAGMPFILLGHNHHAAWGLTLNMADVADNYLETVVGDQVLFNGQWVRLQTRTETILVKPDGGTVAEAAPVEAEVRVVPHHGPLFPREVVGGAPLDIAASWTGYNGSSFLPLSMRLGTVDSYEDLQDTMKLMVAGAVNVVYADVDGNIGYTARADIPIRMNLEYTNPPYMVLPGTGGYEWTGEILPDDLIPWAKNPARGFLVTANNEPAGINQDNDALNGPWLAATGAPVYLSTIYDVGYRADQITEELTRLKVGRQITPEDNMRLQATNISRMGMKMVPFILDAAQRSPRFVTDAATTEALGHLSTWADTGFHCDKNSAGCLIFHAWLPYYIKDLLADETDPSLVSDIDGTYLNMWIRPAQYFLEATRTLVDDLDFVAAGGCVTDPANSACSVKFPSGTGVNYFDNHDTEEIETRDQGLLTTLTRAAAVLTERGGGSLTGLSWGQVHTIHFWDPASSAGYSAANIGPLPLDSGMFSVDVADGRLSSGGEFVTNIDVGTGPSQRTLFELDPAGIRVWDVVAGGQSERPGAQHHADQLDLYLNNQYRELPFYADEVADAEVSSLLLPAGWPAVGTPSQARD